MSFDVIGGLKASWKIASHVAFRQDPGGRLLGGLISSTNRIVSLSNDAKREGALAEDREMRELVSAGVEREKSIAGAIEGRCVLDS